MFTRLGAKVFLMVLGVAIIAIVASAQEPETKTQVIFEEKLLAKILPGGKVDWIVFSPDGKTVAYAAKKAGKEFIVVGDKKGEEFDGVWFPVFSPDGKTVAYRAKKADKEFIVVGDKKGEEFDNVWFPVFSPDGKTVAYIANNAGKWFIVVGDKKGEEFDYVEDPVFSPDGKTVGYRAKKAGKWFIVVGDKKKGEEFDYVKNPVFSPDGKTVAYVAMKAGKEFIVVGDKKGEDFDDVWFPVFSPDGKTVAYVAMKAGKWFIVVGDKKGEEFDNVWFPVFSPDGKTVAYATEKAGKWFIVVGDKKGEEFDEVGPPVFSPDGKTVAYRARKASKWFIVVGDKKGEEFDNVWFPVFSPDGKKVAFGAKKKDELWWKVQAVTAIVPPKEEYIGAYIYEYKKSPQWGSPPYHHIYILEIKEDGSYRLTSGTIVPPEWQYLWQPNVQKGNWEVVTKEEQERELEELGIPREEIVKAREEEVIWFSPPLPVDPAPPGGIWDLIKKGNKLISSASTIEFFPQTADIAFVKKESIEEIESYRKQIESTVKKKEEPKPQIAGYTAKFNDLNNFLSSMRGKVLECPKESCNDEEKAAKMLINHLLTKKSGKWLSGFVAWQVAKKLILSGLDELTRMAISLGEVGIEKIIREIKDKFEKSRGNEVKVVSLGWKDIGVLPIYLPYKERYGNVAGEALMVFYSPHSISFKEIKQQIKKGGSFYLPPEIGWEEQLPDEGTVRPFKLIIRGIVCEVGEVGTRESWGETIKGPSVTFLEDK